jgi:ABC-type multidrug transport system fused ATPase/permease subunit
VNNGAGNSGAAKQGAANNGEGVDGSGINSARSHGAAKRETLKHKVKLREYYRDMYGKIAALAIVAAISATFQAATLIMVVLLGKALAASHHRYVGSLGPLHINITTERLTLLAALGILASAILDSGRGWVTSKINSRWDYEHREMVVSEYLSADYQTQSAERLGTLGVLTGYVSRAAGVLGSITSLLMCTLSLLIYIGSALLVDYRAAILMTGSFIFLSLVIRPVMRRIKRYSRLLSVEMIDYTRDVTEATRMVRDLRVFDALGVLGSQLQRRSNKVRILRQRSGFVSGMVSPIYQYLGMLIVLTMFGIAENVGTVDIVKIGAIALLLIRSQGFGQAIQNAYQQIIDGTQYIERLEEMRETYRVNRTQDGSLVLEDVHDLELDKVRYSYDGKIDAVAGVSAKFRTGEIVGVVGPSGGGKSTLSQLLLRLRVPTGGDIRVNGISSADYKLSSWYSRVSLVPQDPRLFHATVSQNISLFDKRITHEKIVEAAKAAGVHDVIESLDFGYKTLVGPAFRDLSGGQIQRIGIARALARGAQILVLDEPTSALDVHSEAVIQGTLEALSGRALVMIIAHRLSTLSICDRILVIRDGEVETLGTITEVSERSDFFRRALEAGTLDVHLGIGKDRTDKEAADEV